ncbi:hypothetical protein [Rhodococcus sp. NPDC049939]|uniref:hypothetical protein n=1 Tax=Rhodococcus sp. NPDC049939 TaxID=3155511 RepID=UPI0033C5BED7
MRKTGIGIAAVASLALLTGGVANAQESEPPTFDGTDTHTVGTGEEEMAPGIYRTAGGENCNWMRIGAEEAELAEGKTSVADMAGAVIIEATDTEFKTSDCADWEWVDSVPNPPTSVSSSGIVWNTGSLGNMLADDIDAGEGSHTVGDSDGDVTPGIYHNVSDETCTWERLGAEETAVSLGETFEPGMASTVIIEATDAKFTTTAGCGEWTKVAELSEA